VLWQGVEVYGYEYNGITIPVLADVACAAGIDCAIGKRTSNVITEVARSILEFLHVIERCVNLID